jgi:DNA-binding HxlR family transcriptional regulator
MVGNVGETGDWRTGTEGGSGPRMGQDRGWGGRSGQHGGMVPSSPAPLPHRAPSGLESALAQVGDRWSLLVVDALLDGPRRFGQLQVAVAGIATNVLTQRLRHLEGCRVVVARPYSHRPPRSAYELSAAGRELAGALRLLAQWGADTRGPTSTVDATALAHAACGTPLQARWWCPTCDLPVDEPDDGTLIWA